MALKTKVLIVGAGPAGAACAISLQKAGVDCLLVDRQSFPRVKLCAGLFTQKSQRCLLELLGQNAYRECMDACLMSHENEFSIYKGQTCLVTTRLDPPITLINRPKFDAWLVNHYVSLGGKFCNGLELTDLNGQAKTAVFRECEVEYEYLIAADGANSTMERILAKQYPELFHRKAKSALSLEINVDRADVDVTGVNIHLDIISNSYAWTFAKGEKVCMGLVKQSDDTTDANETMRRFMNDLKVRNQQKYPLQGAMIPVGTYMTRPAFRDNIIFVGDAAGFVEPLTDEGIYYALQSGSDAAKAFNSNAKPVDCYLKQTKRLKRMIDIGQFYQRLLEKPWAVNLLYKHAHKHPGFVAYFYETRIEQGCMDSFWKIVLHYKQNKKR